MSGAFTNVTDFWQMSPYDAICMMRAHAARMQAELQSANVRAGTLTAAVYNTMRHKRTDKVWKWSDFYRDVSKPRIEQQTPEQMYYKLKLAFGGH